MKFQIKANRINNPFKRSGLTLLFLQITFRLLASPELSIHTEDITHFWTAYDSVMSTNEEARQLHYIQSLYVDKASEGLKDFIAARNFTASEWLKDIKAVPRFWKSIRPKTLAVLVQKDELYRILKKYKELYPPFIQPEIYLMIGCLRSGGTTSPGKILIETEISAADSTVDASELGHWLQGLFRQNTDIIQMVAHEATHPTKTGERRQYPHPSWQMFERGGL